MKALFDLLGLIKSVISLEKKSLNLGASEPARKIYSDFNARHPKYIVFKRKTIGVALICFDNYNKKFDAYYQSINGKNSAAYYSRKAINRKYSFTKIDPNRYIDDIYQINVSKTERQGRKMSESYLVKKEHYEKHTDGVSAYGILDSSGKLVSYAWVFKLGDVAIINSLLGHADFLNDGIMYLMVSEIVRETMADPSIQYVMYDTYFGALPGLKMFKDKLGFKPYRVKWMVK